MKGVITIVRFARGRAYSGDTRAEDSLPDDRPTEGFSWALRAGRSGGRAAAWRRDGEGRRSRKGRLLATRRRAGVLLSRTPKRRPSDRTVLVTPRGPGRPRPEAGARSKPLRPCRRARGRRRRRGGRGPCSRRTGPGPSARRGAGWSTSAGGGTGSRWSAGRPGGSRAGSEGRGGGEVRASASKGAVAAEARGGATHGEDVGVADRGGRQRQRDDDDDVGRRLVAVPATESRSCVSRVGERRVEEGCRRGGGGCEPKRRRGTHTASPSSTRSRPR